MQILNFGSHKYRRTTYLCLEIIEICVITPILNKRFAKLRKERFFYIIQVLNTLVLFSFSYPIEDKTSVTFNSANQGL